MLPERPRSSGAPRLKTGWPLYLLFGGLFVWWILGLSGFVQAIFALPLLFTLLIRGRVRIPKGFVLWFLFLGLMLISATQLHDLPNLESWLWRATIYLGATVMFLFVFNTPREQLPAKKLVNLLAAFWVLAVVGGILGMVFPNHSFNSLMEALLPQRLLANAFVKALVIPSTTGGNTFAGTHIFRVKAPFIYTNQWGSAFALSLPFAFAVITQTRNKATRNIFIALLILSILPLVFSLDRGSWISAGLGSIYGVFRLSSGRGRTARMAKAARSLLVAGVLVLGLVLLSPLGSLILLRANNGYGDQHRQLLYSSSLTLAARSPIFGFGAPVSLSVLNPSAPPGPSIGTHGTLWTLMISNGIPAIVFFLTWFLYAFWKTRRRLPSTGGRDADAYLWCHVVIFTAIVQFPYYELLPWGLPIVMIAAAMALRERAPLTPLNPVSPVRPGTSTALARSGA
jgi:polysaccharide biosynthesis protein PslJ